MQSPQHSTLLGYLNQNPRVNHHKYNWLEHLDKESVQTYTHQSALLMIRTQHTPHALAVWAQDEQDVIPLLASIPQVGLYDLISVEERFLPIFQEQFGTRVKDWYLCHALAIDSYQSGEPLLESLTINDTDFVHSHWDWSDDESAPFIRKQIANYPTSCIRNELGEPIAMAFCYSESPRYINMGGLKVLDTYRQSGLGLKIAKDITHKVAQYKMPLVHVKVENTASLKIVEKIGFTRYEKVFWGILQFD